jgi:hypothetical protein
MSDFATHATHARAGATFRGHSDKIHAVRREAGPNWAVAGLLVVRGTIRNRRLIGELRGVIEARYAAASHQWLAALRDPDVAMPAHDGLCGPAPAPELKTA